MHHLIISGIQAWLSQAFWLRVSHKYSTKVLAQSVNLNAQLGRISFQAPSHGYWQDSLPCRLLD